MWEDMILYWAWRGKTPEKGPPPPPTKKRIEFADLFDTPEEAATKAAEEESMSDTPNVVILACTPVGGVVVKPVFVPTLEAA